MDREALCMGQCCYTQSLMGFLHPGLSTILCELQSIQTKYLKTWSGIAVRDDPSVLYRPREDSGMSLKEVAIAHKKQRLIRRYQLATSRDPQVSEIHGRFAAVQHRKKTNALRHQWSECVEMHELLAEDK